MTAKMTRQPTPPINRDGKWYFTYYTLKGPRELGPYDDEETVKTDFIKVLRIHQANGHTDGIIGIID